VVQLKYKGKFTLEKIRELAQKMSDSLYEQNPGARVSQSILSDAKWFSGGFTDVGDPIELYEPYDDSNGWVEQEHYTEFRMYVIKKGSKKGGNDNKNNDCMFFCLASVLHERNPFKDGWQLKKYLGLKRKEKIDIDHIPMIEEKLKLFKINVTGDHIYVSPKQCQFSINLKLNDGHYKVDATKTRKINGVSFKECKPILYDSNPAVEMNAYDGDKLYHMTSEEFRQIKYSSKTHVIVNKDNADMTLEENYQSFIHDANELKTESNSFINLYKTGNNITAALDLFDRFTRFVELPEDIEQDEGQWILDASFGALIRAEKGYEGEGHKYDVCSMYPSILNSAKFMIPVQRGEFKQLTQDEFDKLKFLPHGIYRCQVECDDVHPLFRTNPKHYYTHLDLSRAKELGLEINMIMDDQANHLYYHRSKTVNANILFDEFIKFMFELKDKKVPRAKAILNCLWGALCQKNKISHVVFDDSDAIDLPQDIQVFKITPFREGAKVDYYKNDRMFKTNFARIMPFLLAKARATISAIMEPYVDHVVYCHTDSMIVNKAIEIQTGNGLGELKYEGYCADMTIVHKTKVDGTFVC
jgi:hypothetical protein